MAGHAGLRVRMMSRGSGVCRNEVERGIRKGREISIRYCVGLMANALGEGRLTRAH